MDWLPISDELKTILQKMFSYSPFEFSEEFVRDDFWYTKFTWSPEERNDFIEWCSNFLYENKEARELITYCTKNKTQCRKAATILADTFGWKEELPEKENPQQQTDN